MGELMMQAAQRWRERKRSSRPELDGELELNIHVVNVPFMGTVSLRAYHGTAGCSVAALLWQRSVLPSSRYIMAASSCLPPLIFR